MFDDRISTIKGKLEKNGSVTVSQLAKELGVSEKTIRLDLEKMEKMGILKRVHGGAISTIKKADDAYFNESRKQYLNHKETIARLAFDYIYQKGTTGSVYFIDAGTTNYEFSNYLKNSEAVVITNDLLIASNLASSSVILHVTGGIVFNNVNKYLCGVDAINMINSHSASICFIGTSAINFNNGLMTRNNEDVGIKRAMIVNSDYVICLCDHTKFDTSSFVKFADLDEIDMIITDYVTEEQKQQFNNHGITVLSPDGQ